MTHAEALIQVTNVQAALLPFCHRCEIAGSVRRGKENPHDVELVCIPAQEPIDLLGLEMGHSAAFVRALHRWNVIKGGEAHNKYTQLGLGPCNCDVFCATADNWGLIHLIRTGPKAFNMRLVEALRKNKHYMRGGELWNDREVAPTPDEQTVFRAARWDYIPPPSRH